MKTLHIIRFCILVALLALLRPAYALQGDLTGDDTVNLEDFAEFASQWLEDGTANYDEDAVVDIDDLMVLVNNWLVKAESVIINEFMATNKDTLLDGDGSSSDWIELHNSGSQTIDLTGWYLTDDAEDLTQWAFPSMTIASGSYLIIFASGQDDADYPYMDASGYYHTNFKLSADGEYLALVKSDGTTIASEYNNYELDDGTLGYPPQDSDISYGIASSISSSTTLIDEDADKAVLVPTTDIGTTWTGSDESFDDSAWDDYTFVSGAAGGVGFDSAITYDSYISYEIASGSVGCYIRIPFEIDDPLSYSGLTLKVRYDDGFIAYLNGTEVASANAPTSPAYNSTATTLHADSAAVSFEEFDISSYASQLRTGENILAVHGLNQSSTSSDFLISVEVEALKAENSGTSTSMYFETSTPGYVNLDGYVAYVDAPKISQDHGFFTDSFQVGISCDDEAATIRYTTDGSEPSMSNGTIYTDWITIGTTTCLRAVAYRAESGYLPSKVKTATYIFLDDVIAQSATPPTGWPTSSVNGQVYDYEMDSDVTSDSRYVDLMDDALLAIPTISLVLDLDDFVSSSTGIYSNPQSDGIDWERPVSVELINPDGSDGFQCNGGLRIRGGMSRQTSNPKHSFRLFFRSEYGDSKLEYPLFEDEGVDEFDKIDLRTGQNFSWNLAMGGPGGSSGDSEATWLYDIFTRDSHRDMGQPYSRGRYYHVYINGLYWGLYQTDERPNADFGESYFGGDDDDYDAIKSDNDTGAIYATDGNTDGYFALWTEVSGGVSSNSDYFRIQGMNADGTVNSSYTRYLDVENLIDYMIIVFYAGNRDMPLGPPGGDRQPRNLFGVYNRVDPDGVQFIAHDSEHTLLAAGLSVDRVNLSLASALTTQANCNPFWIHQQLMNNDEYLILFADHVHQYFFNDGVLMPDACVARWLERAYEIDTAMIAESARWGDTTVTTPRTVDDDWWPVVNNHLTNYFQASGQSRTDIVLGQLKTAGLYPSVSAPVFSQFGGQVSAGYSLTMSASAGTIYYTTDGTDPRAIGGSVAAAASTYGSALSINHSMTVKARALSGGTWSALNEATFAVGDISDSLRVTEIMYHPEDPDGGADPNTEYIELQNIGSSTINLNLVSFTDGIDFTFSDVSLAPGSYILVVQNASEFTSKYGAGLNMAGVYSGQLDNAGEDIKLVDALGSVIQSFEYKDGWRSITDGDGYSLTAVDPTETDSEVWSDKDGWRASVYMDGSPGSDDSADAYNPGAVVINEVVAHTDSYPNDQIELYNTTNAAINISGWFLSDSDANDVALMKYEIPSGTTIPAGGYVVFTQDDDFGAYFALSENGDNVYLTSGLDTGGALTGYRVQEDFGASEQEVAFGRHLKSTDTTNFVAMSSNTFGAANADPKVGPIVISEIMYHPDWLEGSNYNNDEFEYIELYNNSDSAVTLYDSETSLPWTFTEGIDYTFSADSPVTIAAGGYIVLVKNTDAFSERYPSVSSSLIYGPYDGKLQNDGEKLELSMPGDVDEEDQRCYIRVDRVDYTDGSDVSNPWPSDADGLGSSLTRTNLDSYGNDPANWQAATPSPGQ